MWPDVVFQAGSALAWSGWLLLVSGDRWPKAHATALRGDVVAAQANSRRNACGASQRRAALGLRVGDEPRDHRISADVSGQQEMPGSNTVP